jgi:hypothetical protein
MSFANTPWNLEWRQSMDRDPPDEDCDVVPEKWPLPSVFGTFSGSSLFTAAESEDWLLQSDFGSNEHASPEEIERIFESVPALGTESEDFDGRDRPGNWRFSGRKIPLIRLALVRDDAMDDLVEREKGGANLQNLNRFPRDWVGWG